MSSRAGRRVMGIIAAAVLTLSLAPAAVTTAAGPDASVDRPHCASLLSTPKHAGKASKVMSTKCFKQLAPALRYAAKGAAVPDDITPDTIDQLDLSPAARVRPEDVTTIIGIHWEHADRQGRDRIYFVKGAAPCGSGRVWQIAQLDKGWDSLVSSAEGFGGCGTFVQFAQAKFKGQSRACSPYCESLGPLNDKVLSIRWRA